MMSVQKPRLVLAAGLMTFSCTALSDPPQALYSDYPSETPDKFVPATDSYDYTLRQTR
jgi:hypothetical protein